MSRTKAQKVEQQPETEQQEAAVPPLGESPDEVKEQQNDQTGNEPGLANALVEQIEGRKDAQLAQEDADPENGNGREATLEPDGSVNGQEPTHQAITGSVASQTERDALAVQAAQAGNVKNAFVAETRGERLDTFQPQRIANVRVLVESNDHLDRSGDNVIESDTNKIVMSDGVDEARMIDVQPEGVVSEEFDLGNGIKQTNLK